VIINKPGNVPGSV